MQTHKTITFEKKERLCITIFLFCSIYLFSNKTNFITKELLQVKTKNWVLKICSKVIGKINKYFNKIDMFSLQGKMLACFMIS